MVKSAAKKVMWVGKATVFLVGLAVVLALTVGVSSTALAGTGIGATFNLGQTNTVNAISKLVGSIAGPSLQIDNNSTSAAATALDLQVEAGKAPLRVNSSTEVQNLNADQLNGKSASDFLGKFEAASNSNLLDGKDSTAFANGVNGKATDADKLDGKDSTAFVGATRPMAVVAAGTVSSDGVVLENTSNVTVRKDGTGRYLIDISGLEYSFANFVAVASPITINRVVHTDSLGGDLVVETQDLATRAKTDTTFSFVVYSPLG